MSYSSRVRQRLPGDGLSIPVALFLVSFCLVFRTTPLFEKAAVSQDSRSAPPLNELKIVPRNKKKPLPAPTAATQKPLDPKATFVLEGMKAAKAQLRSGVCDIVLLKESEAADAVDSTASGSVKGTITFADDLGVRKDWVYPEAYAARKFLGHRDDVAIEPSSGERTGYYIRTKEQSIRWFEGRGNVDIQLPDYPVPPWTINFDLKAVGFASWVEFNQSVPWETLISVFLQKPTSDVSQPSENVYVLTWQLGSENSEWIITVDENQGFSPTRAMMRQRPDRDAPWRTVQEFSTTWKEIRSVWVPVSYKSRSAQQPDAGSSKLSLDFSWRSVNEPIPESEFTLESFTAPNTVAVINSTLGRPVVTKPARRAFATAAEPVSQVNSLRAIIVGGNLVFFACLSVFLILKLRAARRGNDDSGSAGHR